MRPESKFWHEVKQNIKGISFTRLETWASAGVPDLLCYNKNGKFFTIELKVSKGKYPILSPHQISFHVRHPMNTFILQKALGPLSIKLYEGSKILELHEHVPCTAIAEGWTKVQEHLVNVT
jgi:hypothetical protein